MIENTMVENIEKTAEEVVEKTAEENSNLKRPGNKGEWSEVYTMFKLLADGKLYAGDENEHKIPEICYPIIKILRDEIIKINKNTEVTKYDYNIQHKENDYSKDSEKVIIKRNGEEVLTVDANIFMEASQHLYEIIKKGEGRSFYTSEQNENFMEEVHLRNVKRDSDHKSDIELHIYDTVTQLKPVLGMSIKSEIGCAPTLLNTSNATLITYAVNGVDFSDEEIEEINSITGNRKLKKRIQAILEKGATITPKGFENKIFYNNLLFIDCGLPTILSEAVLSYFKTSGKSKMADVVQGLKENNPLNFDIDQDQDFYTYKIKRLLVAAALGLYPAKKYNGINEANGYIIVKENGDLICYHFYKQNMVEHHLYTRTKFDTPSSSKNNLKPYCRLYRNDIGELEIQLNFQIRWLDPEKPKKEKKSKPKKKKKTE